MIEQPGQESPEAPAENGHWLTRQNALALVLLGGTGVAFYLCYLILSPFLAPLAWALALAVVAHPLHSWMEANVKNSNVAAGLSVAIVTAILLVPAVFVVHQLVQEAAANMELVNSPDAATKWQEKLEETSFGNALLWINEEVDLVKQYDQFRADLASRMADILRQSAWTIVYVLITIFTLYFMFRDRREARAVLRSLVPLSQAEADDVFKRVLDTIHATVYGSVMMAMLQGALGGLMFWWLGLPAPVMWGVVMGLLATIPNLGTFVIWAPAAAWLAIQGHWEKGLILVVWGMTAIGLIDNVLYPIVVGRRMRMHSLPVFFAILGGLLVFGPAGLILGPVVFAIGHALIEIWRRRTRDGKAAEAGLAAPGIVLPEEVTTPTPPPVKLVS